MIFTWPANGPFYLNRCLQKGKCSPARTYAHPPELKEERNDGRPASIPDALFTVEKLDGLDPEAAARKTLGSPH